MFWKTPKIPASYSIINHRGNWPGDTVISWSLSKHTTRSWICWVPLQFSGHLLKHTVGPKTESLVKLLSCPHSLIASLVFFLPSAVSSPSLSPTKSLARAQGLPPSSRRPSMDAALSWVPDGMDSSSTTRIVVRVCAYAEFGDNGTQIWHPTRVN